MKNKKAGPQQEGLKGSPDFSLAGATTLRWLSLKLSFANTKLASVLPGQHPAHFAVTRQDAETFGTLPEH
ncbi:MAG: hypothetical protein NPIRA05_01160 [Nitrospirales bacterium]|nr:MAG: hypothetical protein NPIRA05_01160 [Nitrospirales bacterium]